MRIKTLALSFTLALTLLFGILGVLDVKAQAEPQLYPFMDGDIVLVDEWDSPDPNADWEASCVSVGDTWTCGGLFSSASFGNNRRTAIFTLQLTNTDYYSHVIGIRMTMDSLSTYIDHYRFQTGEQGTISTGEDVCNGPLLLPTEGLDGTWLEPNCVYWHFTAGLDVFDFRFRFNSPQPAHLYDNFPYTGTVKMEWIMDSDFVPPDPPEPPSPKDLPFAPFCYFTYTQVITDDLGVTETIEIPYTRESNLLSNSSFEEGVSTPDDWDSAIGGVLTDVLDYYARGEGEQNQGQDAIFNSQPFDLLQDIQLHSGGSYMLGGYVRGEPKVVMSFQGTPIAQQITVTNEYELITGTLLTGGGSPLIAIEFISGTEDVWVDDVFYIPVISGTSQLNCDPDFYEDYVPSQVPDDTVPGPISPIPIGGAGSVCYLCTSPAVASPDFVSHWIAWLGCVLRNMFSCSLRVWLLVIGNWLKGLIEMGLAWLDWIPLTAQSGVDSGALLINSAIDWIVTSVENGADWLGVSLSSIGGGYYESGTNIFDLLIALIGLVGLIVQTISNLLFGIVELLTNFLGAISTITKPLPTYPILEINGQSTIDAGELSQAGPNNSKILWLIYMPLVFMDSFLVGIFSNIFAVAFGAVSFTVIIWSMKQWSNFEI